MKTEQKKAVMYGGGSIGRGFLGQLFSMSGYQTCFIDVDRSLVDELAHKKSYTIKIARPEGCETKVISNITAVYGMNSDLVEACISKCNIMATAVGVNILPLIAKTIAGGLDRRFEAGGKPLDIIVCENISDSGSYLKKLVLEHAGHKNFIEKSVGFVSASVGRMVPVSESAGIVVESYNELPMDKDALKTDVSDLVNFIPVSPFAIEKHKKYFMHNMSHAVVAYLGYLKNHTYIWEAVGDREILNIARGALYESIEAIALHFNTDRIPLESYAADLLDRYSNKYLGDTVLRVGRDPVRKLGPKDRLAGAAAFCLDNGVDTEYIPYGIAAAMLFDSQEDASASLLSEYISAKGVSSALAHFSGISPKSPLGERIIEIYNSLS